MPNRSVTVHDSHFFVPSHSLEQLLTSFVSGTMVPHQNHLLSEVAQNQVIQYPAICIAQQCILPPLQSQSRNVGSQCPIQVLQAVRSLYHADARWYHEHLC